MLRHEELLALLLKKGFAVVAQTDKKMALRSSVLDQVIYLNKSAGGAPSTIVIHPHFDELRNKLLEIPGIKSSGQQWYHSSNMLTFPKRLNKGKTPTNYGIAFGLNGERAVDGFLRALQHGNPEFLTPFDDVDAAENELAGCSETTRESLIKARVGQGLYRSKLIEYWGGCAVTGCDALPLLIASHIKPWRDSSNEDRLNHFNGLLLTPNLDQAFDLGYITFDDDGNVIISAELNDSTKQALGIDPMLRLRKSQSQHSTFLHWHRSRIFLK